MQTIGFPSIPLIGRTAEITTLHTALEDALAGQGSVWIIGGASGVGKSRLLNELQNTALRKGVVVVRGQGVQDSGLAYQLWRDVLPRLLFNVELSDFEAGVLREIVPSIQDLVGRSISPVPALDGERGQDRLIAVMQSVLERQPQPVLMIFEEMGWVYESLIPLQRLMPVLAQRRFLIVGSYRREIHAELPQELPDAHFLMLDALSPSDANQLWHALVPASESSAPALAEGNPFYLIEAARTLPENLPASTTELLQARLAYFPAEQRPLLEFAAILGGHFDFTLLQSLVPTLAIDAWLQQGQALAVLMMHDNHWQFSHVLWQETILATIEDAPSLHEQVAQAIEHHYDTHVYAEVLMYHWRNAQNPAQELKYLIRVADAMVHYSARYETAYKLLQHGLTLAPTPPPSRLIYLLGNCVENIRSYNQAITLYDQSIALAEQENALQLQVDSLNHKAGVLHIQSRYQEGFAVVEEALKLAESIGYGNGSAEALTIMAYTTVHLEGNNEAAERYYQAALIIYRQLEHWVGIANMLRGLGIVANYYGDYALAMNYLSEGLAVDERIGSQLGISASLNNLGLAALYNGQFDLARQHLTRALSIRQTSGYQLGIAASMLNLGVLAFYQGDYTLAESYLNETLKIRQSLWFLWGIAEAFLNLANVARVQENFALAQNYYAEALTLYNRINDPIGRMLTLFGQITRQFQAQETVAKVDIQAHLELARELAIANLMLIALTQVAGWQWQAGNTRSAECLWQWIIQQPRYDVIVQHHTEAIMQTLNVDLNTSPPLALASPMSFAEAIAQALHELAE